MTAALMETKETIFTFMKLVTTYPPKLKPEEQKDLQQLNQKLEDLKDHQVDLIDLIADAIWNWLQEHKQIRESYFNPRQRQLRKLPSRKVRQDMSLYLGFFLVLALWS